MVDFRRGLLFVILLGFYAVASAQPANLPPIEFFNTAACNTNSDANPACQQFPGTFADWDAASKSTAQTAINQMPSGKLERVIDLLLKGGLKTIRLVRKTDGATMAGTSVDGDTAYIELDNDFFSTPIVFGNVSERTHALIHELMHVYIHYYVGNNLFSAPFWSPLKIALEWDYAEGMNPLIDEKAWAEHFKKRNQFKNQGKIEEAIAEDITYSRGLGFPSLYSMSEMEEYFAELGSFLVHDSTMQQALPADVNNWFLKTDLGFLLDSQTPLTPVTQMPARHVDVSGQYDYIGMLFVNSSPACTATIVRHGLAVLARHCLDPSWFNGTKPGTKFMFLNLEFRPANGNSIVIGGMDFTEVTADPGVNDFAYIRYPANETEGLIKLPVFDLVRDKTSTPSTIFTVGYPMPNKVQHLERLVSEPCQLTGKTGEIAGFQGELVGMTCPAWYGSSGSLVMAPSPQPGHVQVLGVLSHTFSIDAQENPLPSAIRTDAWGSYTDSNFSPVWLATGWNPPQI